MAISLTLQDLADLQQDINTLQAFINNTATQNDGIVNPRVGDAFENLAKLRERFGVVSEQIGGRIIGGTGEGSLTYVNQPLQPQIGVKYRYGDFLTFVTFSISSNKNFEILVFLEHPDGASTSRDQIHFSVPANSFTSPHSQYSSLTFPLLPNWSWDFGIDSTMDSFVFPTGTLVDTKAIALGFK